MRNQLDFSRKHHGAAGPRGLLIVTSTKHPRFGAIHFGKSADEKAAGVWGDTIPLAIIPERADEISTWRTSLSHQPATIEVNGQAGWLHHPRQGLLESVMSRRARAIHIDLPGRHYEYFLRWFHIRCERTGLGEVVRSKPGTYRITDQADAIDAAVGLLTARVVRGKYITFMGETAGHP